MATTSVTFGIRLGEHEMRIVDSVIQQLAAQNPVWPPTRNDAIRHLIVAGSGGTAAPIASTMPLDTEKPRRSG